MGADHHSHIMKTPNEEVAALTTATKNNAHLSRRVTIICTQCGKVFETKPSHHWRKTCSCVCAGMAKRNKVPKPCPECGKPRMTSLNKEPRMCRPCAAISKGRRLRETGRSPQASATVESEERRRKALASPEVRAKRAAKAIGRKCDTEKTRKFSEAHFKGVKATFRSPDNQTYRVSNITAFVNKNPHLFQPEDVISKGKRSYYSNATLGLSHIHAGRRGSWKGWTLVSFTETFYNRGETLLSVETLVL